MMSRRNCTNLYACSKIKNLKEKIEEQQFEIKQLKQRIEFAKQAVDLFFKTEDESKLLEIAGWE
jgi:hypothetical protein